MSKEGMKKNITRRKLLILMIFSLFIFNVNHAYALPKENNDSGGTYQDSGDDTGSQQPSGSTQREQTQTSNDTQSQNTVQTEPTPIFTGPSNPEKGVEDIKKAITPDGQTSPITATESISDLILKYVNFSLPFLALAAFLGFVYAGFLYVTAYGSDEQLGKSKKILIYSVVGLIVVILSYSIVQLFTQQLVQGIQQ